MPLRIQFCLFFAPPTGFSLLFLQSASIIARFKTVNNRLHETFMKSYEINPLSRLAGSA